MEHDANLPDFDAIWDYDRPEASERAFRALLACVEVADAAPYRLELLTQIARAQGLQRRFDEAHRTLDDVAASLTDDIPRVRLRYLLERGRVCNSSGSPEQAMPFFGEAWDLGRANGEDALAVDAAHMLGIAAPPDEQLAWSQRALALAESSHDPGAQRWRGSLLNNLGWTHHDLGRYDDALALFQRAVAWQEGAGQPRQIITARWCVARSLRSLGRIDEALAMQRDLLAHLAHLGESDGYVHEEIGECLLALDRREEAQPHFAAAHGHLAADPWLAANEPDRLRRLQELGQAGQGDDA